MDESILLEATQSSHWGRILRIFLGQWRRLNGIFSSVEKNYEWKSTEIQIKNSIAVYEMRL